MILVSGSAGGRGARLIPSVRSVPSPVKPKNKSRALTINKTKPCSFETLLGQTRSCGDTLTCDKGPRQLANKWPLNQHTLCTTSLRIALYRMLIHLSLLALPFWFLPIHWCVLALYTLESYEKILRHITRVGFEPTTRAILEQRHTN